MHSLEYSFNPKCYYTRRSREFFSFPVKLKIMSVQILHNPRCSKSRQTLQLLKDQGIEPEIIDYLKTPPTTEQLADILDKLDMQPRDLMRKKEKEYKETGMNDASLDKDALIAGMVATPKLIERPIVLANGKAAIGRPPEDVLAIL